MTRHMDFAPVHRTSSVNSAAKTPAPRVAMGAPKPVPAKKPVPVKPATRIDFAPKPASTVKSAAKPAAKPPVKSPVLPTKVVKPAPKSAPKPVRPSGDPLVQTKRRPAPVSSMPKLSTSASAVFQLPTSQSKSSDVPEFRAHAASGEVELGVIMDYKNNSADAKKAARFTVGDALADLEKSEKPQKSASETSSAPKTTPKATKTPSAKPKSTKLGARSPFFLNSVNVEKRPLSPKSAPARKNIYAKKPAKAPDAPTRPTVIVPSSQQSKAPIFFLILLTVILGTAVGAVAYLCFFQ